MRKLFLPLIVVSLLLCLIYAASAAGPSVADIDVLDTGAWGSFYTMAGHLTDVGDNNDGGEDNILHAICSHQVLGASVTDLEIQVATGDGYEITNGYSMPSKAYRAISDPHGANQDGCHGKTTVTDVG